MLYNHLHAEVGWTLNWTRIITIQIRIWIVCVNSWHDLWVDWCCQLKLSVFMPSRQLFIHRSTSCERIFTYWTSLAAACVNVFNLDSNLDSNLTWISTFKQNGAMEEPAERPMDTHAIGLKGLGIRASLPGDVGKPSKKERMFLCL